MTEELLNRLFLRIAEELDIGNKAFDNAVKSYSAIGEYFNNNYDNTVNVYTQGSFRLGTVIRPLNDEDEYDLDLVCEVVKSATLTPARLKIEIGNVLADSKRYSELLVEKRRCWRIEYSDVAHFHIDITPALPNKTVLDSVFITNKDDNGNYSFSFSNPKGYSSWFDERKLTNDITKRKVLLEMAQVEPVKIENHIVKLPLQRAIQILKRHRDIMFEMDAEYKPISIIITTLSAQAYNGEIGVYDAVKNILEKMSQFIVNINGKYAITNPVDKKENFADKWNTDSNYAKKFFSWLTKARKDIVMLTSVVDDDYSNLEKVFGETIISRAIVDIFSSSSTPYTGKVAFENQSIRNVLMVSHRQRPSFKLPENHLLTIKATYTDLRGGATSYLSNSIAMPKKRGLDFIVLVPPSLLKNSYSVIWQIVNTGEEARLDNGLRGGFVSENNTTKHHEETLYRGTHYVIAYLMRSGKCIAVSDEFIVNIE